MAVFLVDDKNVDAAGIIATGQAALTYPAEQFGDTLSISNDWGGTTTMSCVGIPAGSCVTAGAGVSVLSRCGDGGTAYFRVSSTDIVSPDGTKSYLALVEPRGQVEIPAFDYRYIVQASSSPGATDFSTGSVTLFLGGLGVDGENLNSWQISLRGPSSVGYPLLGVLLPVPLPQPFILGDAFHPNLPVALGGGKVLVITDREDRDGDKAFHPEARVYTMTDSGWTRSAASALPYQSSTAQALRKTLDSSVLVQADKTPAGAAAPGYYVATVTGDVISGGALAAVTGTGPARSHSNSMVGLPGTNDFLAWRKHDDAVYIDLIRVSGNTCSVLSTATVTPPTGLTNPDTPRALILDGATAAIGALSYGTKVQFVRASVAGGVITIDTDELTTTYTEGTTLYPGLNHTAEIMLRDGTAGSRVVKRLGVDYAGTAFTTTALPITQTAETFPPGYELRTDTGGVDPFTDACYFPIAGELYVIRRLSDGPTDSNWIIAQQYDQATGAIKTSEWSKGEMNGSGSESVLTTPLHMVYEPATKQLVVTASEQYFPDVADAQNYSMNARLATFRTNYVLAQSLRSQGWAFSG